MRKRYVPNNECILVTDDISVNIYENNNTHTHIYDLITEPGA